MTPEEKAVCKLCGEPMPPGEEMFFYHGYSGPCPKPPLPKEPEKPMPDLTEALARLKALEEEMQRAERSCMKSLDAGDCIESWKAEHWADEIAAIRTQLEGK